jgi:predicted ribosomally synthesized peptide with nif11-like leader
MAKNAVAQFFAEVYNDKALQGSLHFALAQASPNVVIDIAKKKGFEFSSEELASVVAGSGELSEAELSGAVGGALNMTSLGTVSLQKNFWGAIGGFQGGGFNAAFDLGIPGPSFVHVMSTEERRQDGGEPQGEKASAADVYADLLG